MHLCSLSILSHKIFQRTMITVSNLEIQVRVLTKLIVFYAHVQVTLYIVVKLFHV